MNFQIEFNSVEFGAVLGAIGFCSVIDATPIELLPSVISARDKMLKVYRDAYRGTPAEGLVDTLEEVFRNGLTDWNINDRSI